MFNENGLLKRFVKVNIKDNNYSRKVHVFLENSLTTCLIQVFQTIMIWQDLGRQYLSKNNHNILNMMIHIDDIDHNRKKK